VSVTPATPAVTIDTMAKVNGTTLYIFAAVSQPGSTMASFRIAGMTGDAMATVVGESRTVPVTAGAFSDSFAANGVHIYALDLATVTCP
jgi:hypothetical protein